MIQQVADLLQCRKRVYEIIQLPLQDLDYSTDAAVQERGHLYQDIYEYAVFMRKTAVTGVTDLLSNDRRSAIEGKLRHKTAVSKSSSRVAVILEKSGGGERPDDDAVDSNSASAPDAVDEHRHTELLKEKPRLPAILPSSFRSLKHCMLDLKALSTRAETSSAERNICRMKYDELREVQEKQLELLAYLEKETAELGKLWNRRVQVWSGGSSCMSNVLHMRSPLFSSL